MRLSSFKARVFMLAVLFAIGLVGSVAVVTYFVVSEGMVRMAEERALQLASRATDILRDNTTAARLRASSVGYSGPELEHEARRQVLAMIPELFGSQGLAEGGFIFYDGQLSPLWFTDRESVERAAQLRHRRVLAVSRRQSVVTATPLRHLVSGLWSSPDLGVIVVSVPIELSSYDVGVMDLVYRPEHEEQVINEMRPPMFALAMAATLAAVLIMQTSMGWVLRLVDQLRRAADAVDADQLDVRLPESGEHEISDLARSLNALVGRLRRRAEMQTRFVADASHELATPLAGIRGYVNILRAWGSEDPDVRDEAVRAIDRESRRMARLCSDLLSLVRSGSTSAHRAGRADVNALCREVLAGAATRYIEKGLEFVGPGEGTLSLLCDPDRIEEVIAILVDNAAKYTPSEGMVSVSTARQRDGVRIQVTDTGVGISEADLPNIFERFYRSDASRSKETGGFGLGLAIAKQIVEASGGRISVSSRMGEGTTFDVRLPRRCR